MRTLFIGDLMITFGEGENFARIFAMGVGSHHVCGFCRTVRFMFINRCRADALRRLRRRPATGGRAMKSKNVNLPRGSMVGKMCIVCAVKPAKTLNRCSTCYFYFHRNKQDRPLDGGSARVKGRPRGSAQTPRAIIAMTHEQIAAAMGLSPQRIYQIEKKALLKLRRSGKAKELASMVSFIQRERPVPLESRDRRAHRRQRMAQTWLRNSSN
jgi:DNA-binding XRE family transcriptional regulator